MYPCPVDRAALEAVVCRAYELAYEAAASLDSEFSSDHEKAVAFVAALSEALEDPLWFYDARDVFHDNECTLSDIIDALVAASA